MNWARPIPASAGGTLGERSCRGSPEAEGVLDLIQGLPSSGSQPREKKFPKTLTIKPGGYSVRVRQKEAEALNVPLKGSGTGSFTCRHSPGAPVVGSEPYSRSIQGKTTLPGTRMRDG